MRQNVVVVESLLKYNPILNIAVLQIMHSFDIKISMNVFEFKNLLKSEDKKEKRKSFFRSLIKSVEAGANGTQDYVVKKGSNKDKIASTNQTKYQ